jgi:hypothetical protein
MRKPACILVVVVLAGVAIVWYGVHLGREWKTTFLEDMPPEQVLQVCEGMMGVVFPHGTEVLEVHSYRWTR